MSGNDLQDDERLTTIMYPADLKLPGEQSNRHSVRSLASLSCRLCETGKCPETICKMMREEFVTQGKFGRWMLYTPATRAALAATKLEGDWNDPMCSVDQHELAIKKNYVVWNVGLTGYGIAPPNELKGYKHLYGEKFWVSRGEWAAQKALEEDIEVEEPQAAPEDDGPQPVWDKEDAPLIFRSWQKAMTALREADFKTFFELRAESKSWLKDEYEEE